MDNRVFHPAQVIRYLIWTFALAYLIQIGVFLLYQSGNAMIGQMVLALMMYVPTLGVLFSGGKLSQMGWNPQIRKNIRTILAAWFAPAVLTAAGAALYFWMIPGHFDLSGSALTANAGETAAQIESQGITYPVAVLISAVSAITYAPLINAVAALGEEIGWRGFLYPQLKGKFGRRKGWLLGGVIWGAWHWPVIWLIGYEYGTEYVGFPVTGMLLFCVCTIALGILGDWLYQRSGSIWVPSLFHGAFNAAAGIPLAVCLPGTGTARLLGPAPNGLLAGLPLLIIAGILLAKGKGPAGTEQMKS